VPAPAPRAYHHRNLRSALLKAADHVIRERGIDALTLRGVGDHVGVSRSALYRHFKDKNALLAAVATEGFRAFRQALETALAAAPQDADPLPAMAAAYVQFALSNPSHYRVMFGPFDEKLASYPDLCAEAERAFGVLLNAVREQQERGVFRPGDPLELAHVVWSLVHGIAGLAMNGQLRLGPGAAEPLTRLAAQVLGEGLRAR